MNPIQSNFSWIPEPSDAGAGAGVGAGLGGKVSVLVRQRPLELASSVAYGFSVPGAFSRSALK